MPANTTHLILMYASQGVVPRHCKESPIYRDDEAISAFGGVISLKVMRLLRFARNDDLSSFMINASEYSAFVLIKRDPFFPGWLRRYRDNF